MPRDGGGIYSLPPGNPVVPETIIDTAWANPTMEDLGVAMSDSLSRSGKGGMTAPLRGPDGSEGVPTFSFTSELDSGRWRQGPGQVVESIQGQKVVRFRAAGMDQWNQALNSGAGDWEPLTPRDAAGTPFDPAGIALTSTNVQDAIEEVYDATGGVTTADAVTYDDSIVYFPAATVQIAIDRLGVDVSGIAADVSTLFGDIVILEGDLSIVEAQSLTNASDILVNANNIAINNSNFVGFYNTEFLPLRTRVDDVEAKNIIQDGDITFLLNEQNAQGTRITNNEINISTNTSDIVVLGGRVTQNENELDIIGQDWFNNVGVLKVINGGTGVTTSTGTGSTVRSANPTLQGVQLNGSNNTITQNISNSSTLLATTAFAHAVGTSTLDTVNIDVFEVLANGNGWYMYWRQKDTQIIWLIQWSYKDIGGSASGTVTLPVAYADNKYTVGTTLTVPSTGHPNGSPYAMIVKAKNTTNWTYATNYSFSWLTIGKF